MKLTAAREEGLLVLGRSYPQPGRISNVTAVATSRREAYVYWQTARWLIENELAYEPGRDLIALTPRGVDVVNGGQQCRECGCTDNSACEEGCSWVESDLCSACEPVPA